MGNPWIVRLIILSLFLTLAKMAPGVAWIIVLVCCGYAALAVLAHLGKLPDWAAGWFGGSKTATTPQSAPKIIAENVASAEEMEKFFNTRVIGQETASHEVAKMLYRRIQAPRKNKPLGVFCFAGPPGVGKTLFAKVTNELLFAGNEHTLLHVDMSQFAQPHAVSNLFGQPRGFAGSEEYGMLTGKLRDFPNCIVLLDEFEKAHPEVHRRFLTAWNDGFITEGSDSAQVSTRGAIFILTTNAASKEVGEIADRYAEDPAGMLKATRGALNEAGFAPELLSRIDHVFSFAKLQGMNVARVAALEILALVQENELEVMHGGIDPKILLESVLRYENLGDSVTVRDIIRLIENDLYDGIIEAKQSGAKTVALRDDGEKVRVDVLDYAEATQAGDNYADASPDEGSSPFAVNNEQ